MSKNQDKDNLLLNDDAPLADSGSPQTSNKAGLQSSSRKPSNIGPDSHAGSHKAPVAGAFGNEENREYEDKDTYLGDQVPPDDARR